MSQTKRCVVAALFPCLLRINIGTGPSRPRPRLPRAFTLLRFTPLHFNLQRTIITLQNSPDAIIATSYEAFILSVLFTLFCFVDVTRSNHGSDPNMGTQSSTRAPLFLALSCRARRLVASGAGRERTRYLCKQNVSTSSPWYVAKKFFVLKRRLITFQVDSVHSALCITPPEQFLRTDDSRLACLDLC